MRWKFIHSIPTGIITVRKSCWSPPKMMSLTKRRKTKPNLRGRLKFPPQSPPSLWFRRPLVELTGMKGLMKRTMMIPMTIWSPSFRRPPPLPPPFAQLPAVRGSD
uniref:(northern house mosquito) hypothetical protein n=1 Tax=Culex pipiens TaxID=7175 RepID=A0A8D8ICI2_CULPI